MFNALCCLRFMLGSLEQAGNSFLLSTLLPVSLANIIPIVCYHPKVCSKVCMCYCKCMCTYNMCACVCMCMWMYVHSMYVCNEKLVNHITPYHLIHYVVVLFPVCDQGVNSNEEGYPHCVCSQSEDERS